MLLIQSGDQIAGGGLPVITVPYATYIANKASYDSADVLLNVPDYPRKQIPSDYIGYDQNLDLENIGDIATKSLGKVEYKSDNEALYGHAVGEYFINKNGQYCRCTSAIQTGQTLTENTNYVVTDVGSVLKQINSNFSVSSWAYQSSPARFIVYKYGKMCFASTEGGNWSCSANGIIAEADSPSVPLTLPTEYRPSKGVNLFESNAKVRLTVYTNGGVYCPTALSSATLRWSACWLTD